MINFQLPKATAQRLAAVRASTGLSHAVNLAWGLKQWIEHDCRVEGVYFSEETPGRQQKVIKFPAEAEQDLTTIRQRTHLPLWRIADGALYFCSIQRPPESFKTARNPLLSSFKDEELAVELAARGYRIEKD